MPKISEITVPIRTEVIEGKTLDRIASALERIADTLEKQDAGCTLNLAQAIPELLEKELTGIQLPGWQKK